MPDMIAHSRSSSSPGLRSVVQKSSASGKCETSEYPRSLWQGGAIKE